MEPLTLATTFATIVSLVGQFKSGRDTTTPDEFKDFTSWLTDNNHSELKDLIIENAQATEGIKAVLSDNKDALLQKLQAIDDVVSQVASSIDGFYQLTAGLSNTSNGLSDQAQSVLKQLNDSGASKFVELKLMSEPTIYQTIGGDNRQIEYNEGQFIEDDLSTLIKLGLLNPDYNSQGDSMFIITRAAAKLVATWN